MLLLYATWLSELNFRGSKFLLSNFSVIGDGFFFCKGMGCSRRENKTTMENGTNKNGLCAE